MPVVRAIRQLYSNIGRCPWCMKIAFLCASASWLVYAAFAFFIPDSRLSTISLLISVGLTALWLLHFFTYTARVTAILWTEYVTHPRQSDPEGQGERPDRRKVVWILGNALSLGVMAAVWLPTAVMARGNPCGEGKHCPDSARNCCSRSLGKCCSTPWACLTSGKCYQTHAEARRGCGSGTVVACS